MEYICSEVLFPYRAPIEKSPSHCDMAHGKSYKEYLL